ncbi:MAG TPA: hypothetical protein VMH28_21855 [Candidatus Acidoferrales bacterium]|nr:hypothetical protein [Candidatus Acidoferrales bacterium]
MLKTGFCTIFLTLLAAGFSVSPAAAGTISLCDSTPGNILSNCGFEASDAQAPANWVTDAAFNAHIPVYNTVENQIVNSGSNALMFGNMDNDPLGPAGLSQLLSDVLGYNYTVTFYLYFNTIPTKLDPNGFLKATVNGNTMLTVVGDESAPISGFAQYQFTFTGSGSDTLGFLAQDNPTEWFLDDVTVTGAAPEPSPWTLVFAGFAAVGFGRLLRRRTHPRTTA